MLAVGHKWGMAAWALLTAAPVGAQEAVAGTGAALETVPASATASETGTAIGAALASKTGAASATAPVSPRASVLLGPVQGSDALRPLHGEPIANAVRQALVSRGYDVANNSHEAWGRRLVQCPTPECVEQALGGAEAAFAVVPAVWSRPDDAVELTLTLLQRTARSVNVSGVLAEEPLSTATMLVDTLLAQRATLAAGSGSTAAALPQGADGSSRLGGPAPSEPVHPHAWKAGPAILLTAGATAFVAVGVAAGVRRDGQQLNDAAVGAWSAIGAAAIAGGIAWWVVGQKRRHSEGASRGTQGAALAFQPTRIDLRLRF